MYRVIKDFVDLQDDDHLYHTGETFPRKGIRVSEKRLEELAGSKNRQKVSLIKLVKEEREKDVR